MVNDEGLVIIRTALIFRGAHQAKASSSHIRERGDRYMFRNNRSWLKYR